MLPPLAVLVIAALVVIVAGARLSRYGEEIGERYQLEGAVVGVVILALVTSLPELVIGVMSSRIASANFAVGNAMGSNLYNLTILAIADGFHRTGTLLSCVSRRLLQTCVLSQLLVAGATLALLVKPNVVVGWVGVDSGLLFLAYLGCLGIMTRAQRGEEMAVEAAAAGKPEALASWMAAVPARALEGLDALGGGPESASLSTMPGDAQSQEACEGGVGSRALQVQSMAARLQQRPLASISPRGLWGRVATCAVLILAAGPFLVQACERLALQSGLGEHSSVASCSPSWAPCQNLWSASRQCASEPTTWRWATCSEATCSTWSSSSSLTSSIPGAPCWATPARIMRSWGCS